MAKQGNNKGGSVANLARGAKKQQANGGWFQTGYDSVGEEVRRRDQQQKDYENMVRRFWMPLFEDEQQRHPAVREIVFVDGVPFTYREHNFYLNGNWRNFETCLVGTGSKCPYDEAGNKNYFVGAYTIINTNEWTGRDGTSHKNTIELYAAKGDALKALRILADARGGDLSGCVVRVSRTGDKSPGCGNVFDITGRVDWKNQKVLAKYGLKKPPQPLNYMEILRPKTREQALAWMGAQHIETEGSEERAGEVAY